jgi:hypothetical protein
VELVINAKGVVIDTIQVLLPWEYAVGLGIFNLDELVFGSALVHLGPEHVGFFTGANPSKVFTEDIFVRFERDYSCQWGEYR